MDRIGLLRESHGESRDGSVEGKKETGLQKEGVG